MEIVLDQGQHRHLNFRTSDLFWALHTFPGGLMVRGGHGTFVFANGADDILDCFRATDVNPDYWAEKLAAGTSRSWSEERFRDWLTQKAQERGVLTQARDRVLDPDGDYNLEYEDSARWALANSYNELGIGFPYCDEVDLHDWDPHFLRALDMIVRSVHVYDQHTKAHTAEEQPHWPSPRAELMTADLWNSLYPVGTPVQAFPDTLDDEPLITITQSRAWNLGHGTPCVLVKGVSGGVVLGHVRPTEEQAH